MLLQLILFTTGIITIVRTVHLKHLTANDCPEVDPQAFEVWKHANLSSTYAFLVACWGTLGMQLGITTTSLSMTDPDLAASIGVAGALISMGILFGGILWSGLMNIKASRLRRSAHIHV